MLSTINILKIILIHKKKKSKFHNKNKTLLIITFIKTSRTIFISYTSLLKIKIKFKKHQLTHFHTNPIQINKKLSKISLNKTI